MRIRSCPHGPRLPASWSEGGLAGLPLVGARCRSRESVGPLLSPLDLAVVSPRCEFFTGSPPLWFIGSGSFSRNPTSGHCSQRPPGVLPRALPQPDPLPPPESRSTAGSQGERGRDGLEGGAGPSGR